MVLVIDHKDSFTGNLVHLLANFGKVKVLQAPVTESCLEPNVIALVISPGPGHPKDYPETQSLYKTAKARGIPILGICLGFQIILHSEGAKIVRQPQVLHGAQTPVRTVPESRAYNGLPPPILVGRYHSLQVDPGTIPPHIHITAWDGSGQVPLSFEMESGISGLQFHPDSFLTPHGLEIVRNCLPLGK